MTSHGSRLNFVDLKQLELGADFIELFAYILSD